MAQKRKTVYVGMSGGVDSSVSAALLKRDGYRVVGVFIKVWDLPAEALAKAGPTCTWRAERREAMRAAAHLDIPLLTLDLEKEYKRGVVDYLLAEYRAGRTPNPDVMCNKQIKFGAFYDWAMARGADFVATGHYARTGSAEKQTLPAHSRIGKFATKVSFPLRLSADSNKDQTYFLWNLTGEQLKRILFPIGHLTKSQVRKLAAKFKLPNAEKRDSQGICFIGQIDLKDFLREHLDLKPGQVLNEKGEVIGEHDGALLYTTGERHGFMIDKKSPREKPYFIISRNIKNNTITVGQNPPRGLFDILNLEQVNWINELPITGKKYQARIRHRGELLPCTVAPAAENKTAMVAFLKSPIAPAAGQSVVIYDKNICLGGGVIVS